MRDRESLTSLNELPTVEGLASALVAAGIDITTWGKGGAKTVAHLHKEIDGGESHVTFDPESKVSRWVRVAWVDVLYFDTFGNVFQLYEDRQEYRDGRIRKRQLDSSLGEKFKPDEHPIDAAVRALKEELGITAFDSLHSIGHEQTTHTPDSYPGLESRYDTHSFVAVLNEQSFNPTGYVEEQADKINYYEWRLIRPAGLEAKA